VSVFGCGRRILGTSAFGVVSLVRGKERTAVLSSFRGLYVISLDGD
jgi:hypothetical protein